MMLNQLVQVNLFPYLNFQKCPNFQKGSKLLDRQTWLPLIPHPLLPPGAKGSQTTSSDSQSPSPALGEGFRVRAKHFCQSIRVLSCLMARSHMAFKPESQHNHAHSTEDKGEGFE